MPTENPCRQLVALVDQPLTAPNAIKLLNEQLYLVENGKLQAVPGLMSAILRTDDYLVIQRQIEGCLEKDAAEKGINPETIQQVTRGRINLALLIASTTGTPMMAKLYETLIERIHSGGYRRTGKVDAYIRTAENAVLIPALQSDHRFALNTSQVKVHLPAYGNGDYPKGENPTNRSVTWFAREQIITEMHEKIIELLEIQDPRKQHAHWKQLIKTAQSNGGIISLRGQILKELGLIDQNFQDSQKMQKHFERNTGIKIGQNQQIDAFFQSQNPKERLRLVQ